MAAVVERVAAGGDVHHAVGGIDDLVPGKARVAALGQLAEIQCHFG